MKITIVDNIPTDDCQKLADKLKNNAGKIIAYAKSLSEMPDARLCDEYMAMMADMKSEIEKRQIKHEMSKRFFQQWATDRLKE